MAKKLASKATLLHIRSILKDLSDVRKDPDGYGKVVHMDHAIKLLRDVGTSGISIPSAETYVSPLVRARDTAHKVDIALHAPGGNSRVTVVDDLAEIHLAPDVKPGFVKFLQKKLGMGRTETSHKQAEVAEEFAHHGMPAPLVDTDQNRALIADIDHAFEGGESNLHYARRIIKSQAAILMHAAKGSRWTSVEAIIKGLPDPSKEFIEHVFDVQKHMKKGLPSDAHREDVTYQPLSDALEKLSGSRIVFNRHGNTAFSDNKILTGGQMDADLTSQGHKDAIDSGLAMHLNNAAHPCDGKIIHQIGHSAALALSEAALCASLPKVDQHSNGKYDPGQPHVIDLSDESASIRPITLDSLEKEIDQDIREIESREPTPSPTLEEQALDELSAELGDGLEQDLDRER